MSFMPGEIEKNYLVIIHSSSLESFRDLNLLFLLSHYRSSCIGIYCVFCGTLQHEYF